MGGVRPILNVPSCLLPLKSPALGVSLLAGRQISFLSGPACHGDGEGVADSDSAEAFRSGMRAVLDAVDEAG